MVKTQLNRELADLVAEARTCAFVDLRYVTFMDSTGLSALCSAERKGHARNRRLVLTAASEPVTRLLELTGLWDEFEHGPKDPSGGP